MRYIVSISDVVMSVGACLSMCLVVHSLMHAECTFEQCVYIFRLGQVRRNDLNLTEADLIRSLKGRT